MIPKAIEELTLEIAEYLDTRERKAYGDTSGKNRKKVEEDPEVWLASLLGRIKKDLPEVSATLYGTVERSFFERSIREATEKLHQTS